MDVKRAMEIYESKDMVSVTLGGLRLIENVDEANGMATVQIGSTPQNTETVSVDRLCEGEPGIKH